MSIVKVREHFRKYGLEDKIIEFDESTATSQMAADVLGVGVAQICKTLSFEDGNGGCILVQIAGDMKIKGSKFKSAFGLKPKMLSPDEVTKLTGYKIGGVCGFAIGNDNVKIYLDESLKRFEIVYPACGSDNSIAKLNLRELELLSGSNAWVDVGVVR